MQSQNLKLEEALHAWGSKEFQHVLKTELETLPKESLPLQDGLSQSSHVSDSPFKTMVISSHDNGKSIEAKVGVFYSGVIAGCSCADDPTPIEEQPEYLEMLVTINKKSAAATFNLAVD